jgi:anti-sigma regulatory factor (Ser/Thr protein kinase)
VTYIITDEGKGFDHAFFKRQKHYKNKGLLLHGRGIMISTSIFDQVRYNKQGNEVRLTKRF